MARYSKKFVSFKVSAFDVRKEMTQMRNNLAKTVSAEVRGQQVPGKIVKEMSSRLSTIYPQKGGRIGKVLRSLGLKRTTKQVKATKSLSYLGGVSLPRSKFPGNPLQKTATSKNVHMHVGHIPTMDEETLIATLDQMKQPKHIGPTSAGSRANQLKAIGSPSSYKYSLWRILEMRRKKIYRISAVNANSISYTTAKDNYENWHGGQSITWMAGKQTSRNAYYMLNVARQVHHKDRNHFQSAVESGIVRYLKSSRFKK